MGAPRLSKSAGSERRSIPRIDVRQSDGLRCRIFLNQEELYNDRPYDISMSSIAIHVSHDVAKKFQPDGAFEFSLEIPDHGQFVFVGKLVLSRKDERVTKLAFAFDKPLALGVETPEIDQSGLFVFPPMYSINAFIYKPNFFFERSYVRLESIANRCINFEIFDFEILLFPRMKIDLFLFDPGLQLPPVAGHVRDIVKTSDRLKVSISIDHFPKILATRVAEVLILDLQMSIEGVRKLGLPVPKISDGLRFRYIKTAEEYLEVLNLRLKAYQLAGKVADGKTAQDMVAPLDNISRILVAYHGNKIVSSVSISFPMSNDVTLDTERAFPGGYPKKIPSKTDCVEIARLCTDPEYRGSDLLLRMFEHTYRTLQCGGRKFIITSTDHKLWPLYKKLGFKKTGMKYAHPYLAGLMHDVILVPVLRAQTASGIDPLRWNYLYRDMNEYLIRRGVIQLNFVQRVWLGTFKFLGRLLRIRTKRKF